MRARLLPLKGKYYGTEVEITDDLGSFIVNIWRGHGEPSDRELAPDFTREDWDKNIKVPGGWGGEPLPIQQADIIDPSHYESVESLDTAIKLVSAVNGYEQ